MDLDTTTELRTEETTHSALDGRSNLEPPLGILEPNVGIVQGEDGTVGAALEVDEESIGGELLDGPLHYRPNFDFRDVHELAVKNRGLE